MYSRYNNVMFHISVAYALMSLKKRKKYGFIGSNTFIPNLINLNVDICDEDTRTSVLLNGIVSKQSHTTLHSYTKLKRPTFCIYKCIITHK